MDSAQGMGSRLNLLDQDRLWQESPPAERAGAVEKQPQQVPWESEPPNSFADVVYRVELFGLDPALEPIANRGMRRRREMRVEGNRERDSAVSQGTGNILVRLREAMAQEWRRAILPERSRDEFPLGSSRRVPFAEVLPGNEEENRQAKQVTVSPPSPSDILTASSIRMMLSMAMTFRRSNPAVLGAMCETLLEVLLETPPLSLSPLCHDQTSIEAYTFRRVGDFCAALIRSPDHSERQHALGVYLALAVSRGAVSDLLEVVRCLLDNCREPDAAERNPLTDPNEFDAFARCAVSAAAATALSRHGTPMGSTTEVPGVAKGPAGGDRRGGQANLLAVLGRLAEHRVEVELPLSGDNVVVVAKISRHVRVEDGEGNDELGGVECDHPVNAATDGKFVYVWHPDIGAVKVGTGFGGTTKDRLYAENSGAGRLDPGCALSVALPSAGEARRDRHANVDVAADLARRATDEGRISIECADDLKISKANEAMRGADACADGEQQHQRLLVHYTWRGLHDLESFSKKEPVELPTARARQSWHRRREVVSQGSTDEKPQAVSAGLCIVSAAYATFGEALQMLSKLRGDDGETLRLVPGSLRHVVGKYLRDNPASPHVGQGTRTGFLAVVGGRVYLQTGMPSHRFLSMRASDLGVDGIIDAPSLMLRSSILSSSAVGMTNCHPDGFPFQIDCESKAEDAGAEGETGDVNENARSRTGQESADAVDPPFFPLCCDGQLVYALLPSPTTGGPAVVSVDPANGWRAIDTAIDLHGPVSMLGTETQFASASHCDESESTLGGGEWPWWQTGAALPGVRTYCDGEFFVVRWIDSDSEAEVRNASNVGQSETMPQSDSVPAERPHTAVFRLSTGEFCEPDAHNVAQLTQPFPPLSANTASGVMISQCSVRRPTEQVESGSCAAELYVCLARRAARDINPDGPFGWKAMLQSLAAGDTDRPTCCGSAVKDGRVCDDSIGETHDENLGRGIPALSGVAAFVLAHLDRIAANTSSLGMERTMLQGHRETFPDGGCLTAPFCYDLSPETFGHLVGLVETFSAGSASFHEKGVVTTGQEQLRFYVLCSSLRLLRVNIGVLVSRGMEIAQVGGESWRQSLLKDLLALAEGHLTEFSGSTPGHDSGRSTSAALALRLVVEGMDLFYPTPRRQAHLLAAYLDAYAASDTPLPVAAREFTLELLARVSSVHFLQDIRRAKGVLDGDAAGMRGSVVETEDPGPGLPPDSRLSLGPDVLRGLTGVLLDFATVRSTQAAQAALDTTQNRDDDRVERAVFGALTSVLDLRRAVASSVSHPIAEGTEDFKGKTDCERYIPLFEFLLLVLHAANHILSVGTSISEEHPSTVPAPGSAGLLPRVVWALRQGLVGALLPSVIAACWGLLGEVGGEEGVGVWKPAMSTRLISLLEPLVGVVSKLGALAEASSKVGWRWGVDGVSHRGAGATQTVERRTEGSTDGDGGCWNARYMSHESSGVVEGSPVSHQMVLFFGKESWRQGGYDCASVCFEGPSSAGSTLAEGGTPGYDELPSDASRHWLVRLEVLCAVLGAGMVKILVRGEPRISDERDNAQWLRHPLLLHGVMQPLRRQGHPLAAGFQEWDAEPGDSEVMRFDETASSDNDEEASMDRSVLPGSLSYPDRRLKSSGRESIAVEELPMDPRGRNLVLDLCGPPSDPASRALASAMKRVVREDQGRDQGINEAVWAVAAAVIHHAGLTSVAWEVARAELAGRRPSTTGSTGKSIANKSVAIIPPALIRAWRSAQQVRFWLQNGASPDRDRTCLIRRASFLVLLEPWALTSLGQQLTEHASSLPSPRPSSSSTKVTHGAGMVDVAVAGLECTRVASEHVLQFLLQTNKPALPVAASRGDSKAAVEEDNLSADTASQIGDTSVLLRIIQLRSARATSRSRGFSLAEQLLAGTTSGQATAEVLRAVGDGLVMACFETGTTNRIAVGRGGASEQVKVESVNVPSGSRREDSSGANAVGDQFAAGGGLHFMSGLHCCDARSKTQLTELVRKFLRKCASVLRQGREGRRCGSGGGSRDSEVKNRFGAFEKAQAVRMEALRVIAMDYEADDVNILHSSEILPCVVTLLDDPDPSVATAASEAMQALYRCVVLVNGEIGSGMVSAEGKRGSRSRFQEAFLAAIGSRLQEVADAETPQPLLHLKTMSLESATAHGPPGGRALLEGPLALRANQAGVVVPHFPISTRNTLSLWVFIPPTAAPNTAMGGQNSTSALNGRAVGLLPGEDAAATPGEAAAFSTTLYVVPSGVSCVVRRDPSLYSEYVGTLSAGADVEVVPPHRDWADHPLVVCGRLVRVSRPMEGYASRYADGSLVLVTKSTQEQHLRGTSNDNIAEGERGGALSATPGGEPIGDEETEPSGNPMSYVRPTVAEGEGEGSDSSRANEPRSSSSAPVDGDTLESLKRRSDGMNAEDSALCPQPGGILLFKGNEVLLGQVETRDSWNRLGIEVSSAGALRFFVGAGGLSEVNVSSPDNALFNDCTGLSKPDHYNGTATPPRGCDRAPGWFHVAVVQDSSDVRLFLNGQSCGSGQLPPYLIRRSGPDYRVSVKEVESAHPYPNSADDFWEVHIPGAISVTVRFDPKSKTEPDYDFVRFYKDDTRTQTWGLDKYHGGQAGSASNWPGVDLPPLEIPAASFLVHFHSDGSNNDYGFRLIAEGRLPVLPEPSSVDAGAAGVSRIGINHQQHACADVSRWPLYLGQPPLHASPRRTIHGGVLAGVWAWDRPLLAEEVAAIAAEPPPPARARAGSRPDPYPDLLSNTAERRREGERHAGRVTSTRRFENGGRRPQPSSTAHILALVHACCRTEFGRQTFSNAPTVRALLRLVLLGSAENRALALRVCRVTLAWVEPHVVDHEFRCIVRERDPTFDGSFVEGCLLVVGKIVGVWKNFISVSPPSPQRHASVADSVGDVGLDDQERGSAVTDMLDFLRPHGLVTHARISAQEAFCLSSELLSLMRGLVSEPADLHAGRDAQYRMPGRWEAWAREMAEVVCAWLLRSRPLVTTVQGRKALEEKLQWARAKKGRQDNEMGNPQSCDDMRGGLQTKGISAMGPMVAFGVGGAGAVDNRACDGVSGNASRENERDTSIFAQALEKSLPTEDFDRVVAVLCLLGGNFEGLHLGATVICKMPHAIPCSSFVSTAARRRQEGRIDAAAVEEQATVIGLALAPAPSLYPLNTRVSAVAARRKRLEMRWECISGRFQQLLQRDRADPGAVVLDIVVPLEDIPGAGGGGETLDAGDTPAGDTDSTASEPEQMTAGAAAVHTDEAGEARGLYQAHRGLWDGLQILTHPMPHLRRRGRWHGPGRLSPDVLVDTTVTGEGSTPPAQRSLEANIATAAVPTTATLPAIATNSCVSSPVASPQVDRCGELVTVATVGGGRGGSQCGARASTLPVDRVRVVSARVPPALVRSLMAHAQEFVPQLSALLESDAEFNGPSYSPLETVSDLKCVVESEHPYRPGEDRSWPLVIKGAETVEISFDPRSRFARPGDQLILSWRTPWGAGGHRRLCPCPTVYRQSEHARGMSESPGDESTGQIWPGVGGSPPIVVMAEALSVRFVSAAAAAVETSGVDPGESGVKPRDAAGAWGFRLTASGSEVRRTNPPAQPPSLERAMLCDLRARAIKSVAALLEHDEASVGLAPLMPALIKVALSGGPEVRGGSGRRTRTLESSHPYENNIRESFHMSFKGASRLSIAFDSKSRTETNCDYVVFYKDANHVEHWGEDRYSGRDGAENWPGCGHRPLLQIPASEVFIEWVTDSTVTDWGWKMTATADFDDVPATTSPNQLEQRLSRTYHLLYEQPKRPARPDFAAFSLAPTMLPPSTDVGNAPLGGCRTERATGGSCVAEAAVEAAEQPTAGGATSSEAGETDKSGPPLQQGPGVHAEQTKLGTGDKPSQRYVVCMGGIEAFAFPSQGKRSEVPAAQLRDGATVVAVAQEQDWLKIVYDRSVAFEAAPSTSMTVAARPDEGVTPPIESSSTAAGTAVDGGSRCSSANSSDTPPIFLWVRQREDDAIFLLPEGSAKQDGAPVSTANESGIVITIPPGEEEEEQGSWGWEEAMEEGKAETGQDWDQVGRSRTAEVAYDMRCDLQGHAGEALWSFAAESLCSAAARFSMSAVLTAAARWRGGDGNLFSPELFGSFELFWEFLQLTSFVERGNFQSSTLSALKLRVVECVKGSGGGAFGRSLVDCALGALRKLAAQPGKKTLARVFETSHPYEDNMDMEWKVHLPGAHRIKVVFDPRSRTETNCDWVTIAQEAIEGSSTQEQRRGRSARYHGRRGSENFPGFGGRPPLWLDGDRFVARFRSDPTSTDWGIRFTAYGVLDGGFSDHGDDLSTVPARATIRRGLETVPAGSDRDDGAAEQAATNVGRGAMLELDLSCWVLELLVREAWSVPEVAARFCDTETIAVLHRCLKAFCQRWRLRVLRLVTCVAAEVGSSPSVLSPPLSRQRRGSADSDAPQPVPIRPSGKDVRALLRFVLTLTETQRRLESETSPMSPYLQALVQCAVLLHSSLVSVDEGPDGKVAPSFAADEGEGVLPSKMSVREATHDGEDLYEAPGAGLDSDSGATAVRDVALVQAMLSDFARGTTPVRLLLENVLPILTEAFSVTVQSTHPFNRLSMRQSVSVPGAVALHAQFDSRTEMGEADQIILGAPRQQGPAADHPGTGSASRSPATVEGALLCETGGELSFFGLSGGTSEDTLPPISVGDLVVRGPDWIFGNEDGGEFSRDASSSSNLRIGVVIALERWAGRDGGGARVRWTEMSVHSGVHGATQSEKIEGGGGGGERFEALYSVQNPTHLRVVKRGGADRARRPVVVSGDTLNVEAITAAEGSGKVNMIYRDGISITDEDERGGRTYGHSFKFDGESTHVELPSYGGMRLEGDFTLEVWAWLDPGMAHNGKPKCVLSRVLDQTLVQSRRPTKEKPTTTSRSAPVDPATTGSSPMTTPATFVRRTALSSASKVSTPTPSSPIVRRDAAEVGSACSPAAVTSAATATGKGGTEFVGAYAYEDPPRTSVSGGIPTVGTFANLKPRPTTVPISRRHSRSETEDTTVMPRDDAGHLSLVGLAPIAETVEGDVRDKIEDRVHVDATHNDFLGQLHWRVPDDHRGGHRRPEVDSHMASPAVTRAPMVHDADVFDGVVEEERCVSANNDDRAHLPWASEHWRGKEWLNDIDSDGDEDEMGDVTDDYFSEDQGDSESSEDGSSGHEADHGECDRVGKQETSSDIPAGVDRPVGMFPSQNAIIRGGAAAAVASGPGNPGVVIFDNVYLGLRVMRGPDWTYRQQDGGVSNVGTVVGTRGLDGTCPPDGDNALRDGWTKVLWDNGRSNSYETGANGKYTLAFADAVPTAPRDLVVSSVTDRSISIRWTPPDGLGRPPLHSYAIFRDGLEIATVAAGTLSFTNTNRMRGWPYSYSVSARGLSGESPRCPSVESCTATQDDRRTQLALWVGGRGTLHFAMGNERGKGVLLEGQEFPEGVWTHLAVTMEGRKVSVFVDGKRWATGQFVGRRLCSRKPSLAASDLPPTAEQPSVEPLILGSRGAQDYWPGRLCDVRVWGCTTAVADVHRRMTCLPSASLVRADPPAAYRITVPTGGEGFHRLRVHAPLSDPPRKNISTAVGDGAAAVAAADDDSCSRKAYYEVVLRSGGSMQVGWALPTCSPSSRTLGTGDDEFSWACDGLRSMKWHGTTSPVSSPYAHGVPYGDGWKWRGGDVIGCAVDLDAGVMSFSQNGRNLGPAFMKARRGETGRWRVIAPKGLVCHLAIDPSSPIVEFFVTGTVLQISQFERTSGGLSRLRTAEGWVSQRSAVDPDTFFLERLEQDTCPFVRMAVGPERCVFIDSLRVPSSASTSNSANGGGGPPVQHTTCKEILVGTDYAEVGPKSRHSIDVTEMYDRGLYKKGPYSETDPLSRSVYARAAAADVVGTEGSSRFVIPKLSSQRPVRSLLTRSVEVGNADDITFVIELFVPAAPSLVETSNGRVDGSSIASRSGGGGALSGAKNWRWGVVLGEFDVYLSTLPCRAERQDIDNGGNLAGEAENDAAASAQADDADSSVLHVVIDGPGGFEYKLPVSAAFRGRWMTLKIVARRSGESLLTCTPGSGEQHLPHGVQMDDSAGVGAGLMRDGSGIDADGTSSSSTQGHVLSIKSAFSNPRFFRGDRVGRMGLYSLRSTPVTCAQTRLPPFRARHAMIVLGTMEGLQVPTLPRLRRLEVLMAAEYAARLAEPVARPLLIFARRLRRLWSGDVSPSAVAGISVEREIKTGSSPSTLTVCEPLLPAGQVPLGTAVFLSRSVENNSIDRVEGEAKEPCGGGSRGTLIERGSIHKRCLTAWEHPALQTPARFDPVPLPPALWGQSGPAGEAMWAWAPVPRSESYVAVGLVFTTCPEPPRHDAARCVLRELVKGADPQKCKVVVLTAGGKRGRHGDRNSGGAGGKQAHCSELVLVKEMGVCVPRDGAAWGLSPRVVLGDPGTNPDRRKRRWEGLMPALSCVSGESMVINIGRSPFRYPMEGYRPLSEMIQANARLVLQVYRGSEPMWEDVSPSDGLLDGSLTSTMPDLIGRWLLDASAQLDGDLRRLPNDVLGATDACSVHGKNDRGGGNRRLPPARALGVFEATAGVPLAPPLMGKHNVWGFSAKVVPRFPRSIGSDSNPWLQQRFKEFLSLMWGEQTRAPAVNAQLIRCINAVVLRRGMSKETLLSCDWAAMKISRVDLAPWPLLQSVSGLPPGGSTIERTSIFHGAGATQRSMAEETFPSATPSPQGGVEERKESGVDHGCADGHEDGRWKERNDEWIAVAPSALAGGVLLHDLPLSPATGSWRLAPGQIAQLLPPREATVPGQSEDEEGTMAAEAEVAGWRQVGWPGCRSSWLALSTSESRGIYRERSGLGIELYEADRCLVDGFSVGAYCIGETAGGEVRRLATTSDQSVALEEFWEPLSRGGRVTAAGGSGRELPSPFSAVPLQGDSDALLISAADFTGASGGGVGEADGREKRSLMVAGNWKIGLVTDTLTITTRTSGYTRIVPSSVANIDADERRSERQREADTFVAAAATVAAGAAGAAAAATSSAPHHAGSRTPVDTARNSESTFMENDLPLLMDGLVFGFRAADGLLAVARACPTVSGERTTTWDACMNIVEPRAVAYLGGVDEGMEVAFSVIDAGEDVMFSCRELSGRRRAATVRARCRDSWGRGRVAFGVRTAPRDGPSGWLKVVSQAHGATVRSGMSIDTDAIVGRIPCGTVVPYDRAVIYTSPGVPDRNGIDPVVRYRCIATATTPAGWISERGRYANHPYLICEQVKKRPRGPVHLLSHASVGHIGVLGNPSAGAQIPPTPVDATGSLVAALPLPRPRRRDDCGGGLGEWQQRLNELSTLSARFHLLQRLNHGVSQALPYVDFSQGEQPWSLAALLSRCRHLIFSPLKLELWHAELARTARDAPTHDGSGSLPLELKLNRGRAARRMHSTGNIGSNDAEEGERKTLFGQAFRALREAPIEAFRLRPGEALYTTVFVGEHAHDAGGPYRESFAVYCAELQSDALPLLVRCPNAVNDVGINREKWVPNPAVIGSSSSGGGGGSSRACYAEMLSFLGRLMGVAIRSRQPLALDLPSIVWKQLVRSPITGDDLEAIDCALTKSLAFIRNIHLRGVTTEEEFRELKLGGFEVVTVDGRRVELPNSSGGSSRDVTLENRIELAEMTEAFKMQEFHVPVEAIRRGMASVVPCHLLRLFSWDELEVLVCGTTDVDIDLLEACTEYSLCNRHDPHITAFWDVLRSFSAKEQSLFLRFTWGRSRLPMNASQFQQHFKLQAFSRTPPDSYLPVAHTCFWSLELPRYSNRQIMEERLRYAIHNCQAIDADDTSVGRDAAGMGWGEEL